jgi:hypothetical protein
MIKEDGSIKTDGLIIMIIYVSKSDMCVCWLFFDGLWACFLLLGCLGKPQMFLVGTSSM